MTGHRPLKDKIQGFIAEIMLLDGIITCALVSKDGLIMGKSCEEQISTPTFGAMSATMFASAEAAASVLHLKPPETVEVDTSEGLIIVQGAGERALISVVLGSSADNTTIKAQLKNIARRIGEEV
jgi:predicted regulator of Ras-like GTPase activity (Roadblock/LC7/MglB family)